MYVGCVSDESLVGRGYLSTVHWVAMLRLAAKLEHGTLSDSLA